MAQTNGIEWGSYEGRERVPCPEDPVLLKGLPVGMYHCPYCLMMCVACVPHPPPDESDAGPGDEDCKTTTPYEETYGAPWPLGYRVSLEESDGAMLLDVKFEVVEDKDGTFTRAVLRVRHPPSSDPPSSGTPEPWSRPKEVTGPYRRSRTAAVRALLLDLVTRDDDFVRLLL